MAPHTVRVELGARGYEVVIGSGLLGEIGERCAKLGRTGCAIITDSIVGPLYVTAVEQSLRAGGFRPTVLTVPAGENSKSMGQAAELCEQLIAAGLDRGAFLVALGGGVIGDLAGFVASIFLRGIPYVQVPTTVLAQVDSSVGGKTGVNARAGKNLIGAFHQPRLVLADVETLRTLPEREFNEGFAEIIKHGAIRDRAMLDRLHVSEREALAELIARNVAIKARIVAADEHETSGERALLNFGHTIGHGIENAAGYGRYLHGEAISLGLVAACNLSVRHAGLPASDRALVLDRLRMFKLPTQLPPEISTDAVMGALAADKKFAAGAIRFVLTPRLGEAFVSREITREHLRAAIDELRGD